MFLLYFNQKWEGIVQLCFSHKSSSSALHPQSKAFGSVPKQHGPIVNWSHEKKPDECSYIVLKNLPEEPLRQSNAHHQISFTTFNLSWSETAKKTSIKQPLYVLNTVWNDATSTLCRLRYIWYINDATRTLCGLTHIRYINDATSTLCGLTHIRYINDDTTTLCGLTHIWYINFATSTLCGRTRIWYIIDTKRKLWTYTHLIFKRCHKYTLWTCIHTIHKRRHKYIISKR